MCKLCLKLWETEFDGAPSAMKVARSVQSGGKSGDNIEGLPITIRREVAGHETVDGGRRRCPYRPYPCPAALRPVWIMPQTNTTRRALPLHAGGRGKGGISF